MKKIIISILTILIFYSNENLANENSEFNLDFETSINGKFTGWSDFGQGSYKIGSDSKIFQHGKNSAFIESIDETSGYKAWSFNIPAKYQGDKVKLTGYLKTENIVDGYAGLWMRIDPGIGFDNMQERGIIGTKDWQKYEIELDLNPLQAKTIVVGGLLVGKGKLWIDNLKLTIDGQALNAAPKKLLQKAKLDMEFDQGSKINSIKLSQSKVKNLKILGQIWGFLKYYHPHIAQGKYNWDFELFRIVPKIINAKSDKKRNKILFKWIQELGIIESNKDTKLSTKTDAEIESDLAWITGSNFSKKLTNVLLNIKKANRPNNHYYFSFTLANNPEFTNESPYQDMNYPDVGFRLLSLYRYWNTIQYFFPYKNLIDEDWKDVLTEFIPKFINARNENQYKLAVLEIITRIHDTHATIMSPENTINEYWGINYAPLDLSFIENKAVITGYLDEKLGRQTGLVKGDVINKINNTTISKIIDTKSKYIPASNYPTQLRDIAKKLLRTNDNQIAIEYEHNGVQQNKEIKAFSTDKLDIYKRFRNKNEPFKLISNDIAYINIGSIKIKFLNDVFRKFSNKKGLIIDLRRSPSEYLVNRLSAFLLPNEKDFVKFTITGFNEPGTFTFTESLQVGTEYKYFYKGNIVLLVNENTQSQGEYTAMALSVAPHVTVIGSSTAGADGNVSLFSLPGGVKTAMSGIGVYYPDGRETQRIGIVPDIVVKQTIKGIKQETDELLEAAIEYLNHKYIHKPIHE